MDEYGNTINDIKRQLINVIPGAWIEVMKTGDGFHFYGNVLATTSPRPYISGAEISNLYVQMDYDNYQHFPNNPDKLVFSGDIRCMRKL